MMTDYIFKTNYLDSKTADYQRMTGDVVYEVNRIVCLFVLFTSGFDLNIMNKHNNMKLLFLLWPWLPHRLL